MASESKKREVLQLLRDYRAWHTPHGGAMPLDETGVADASYGPAGLIEAGQGAAGEDLPGSRTRAQAPEGGRSRAVDLPAPALPLRHRRLLDLGRVEVEGRARQRGRQRRRGAA
jgi:hypothetical protein